MAKLGMPAEEAKGLPTSERILLLSDTDWQGAVQGEIVTTMMVKGLIVCDAGGDRSLTDRGRPVLRTMLHEP
jgi:hypothetical protein